MKKLLLTLMACLAVVTANAWTVYFTNHSGWPVPYVWAWKEGGDGKDMMGKEWPGQPMTNESGKWTYTQSDDNGIPDLILFSNNGSNQTENLVFIDGVTYNTTGPDGWPTILYMKGDNVNGKGAWDTSNPFIYDTDTQLYTWEGTSLGTSFKVADKDYSQDYNFGAGSGSLKVGTAYSYGKNAYNNIQFEDTKMEVINPKVVVNTQAGTILVTGQQEEAKITVFLAGNFTSWASDLTDFQLTSQDEITYQGSFTLNKTYTYSYTEDNQTVDEVKPPYFKIVTNQWLGCNNAKNITLTKGVSQSFTLADGQDNLEFSDDWAGGTVQFTYNYNTNELTLLSNDTETSESEPNYSDWWVNVVGPFNDWEDNGAQPKEDNIATVPESQIGNQGFKIKIWDTKNAIYYIAENNPIPLNQWVQLVEDTNNGSNIMIEGATATSSYEVQYNVETNKVYVSLVGGSTDPTPAEPKWTVKYTNPDKWDEVYIWAWNDTTGDNYTGGTWPGDAMTYDATSQEWSYSYTGTLTTTPEFVIFNNNDGSQTYDLTFKNGETYTDSAKPAEPTVPENPEGEWTVYFTNPNDWSTVYVWAWNETLNENYTTGVWPGVEMTYDKATSLWSYSGKGTPEYVIFNNNSDDMKTGNLKFVDGATYDMNGVVVNTLYLIGGPKEWDPSVGTEMEEYSKGIYYIENVVIKEDAYFGFTSKLAEDPEAEDAWDIVNANRYGAPLGDMTFDTKGANAMVAGQNSWSIAAGTYSFYVNFNTNTVATTLEATEESPALALYLRGASVNGESTWENAKAPLTYNATKKVWTWTGQSLGTGFKIGDATWSADYNIGAGESTFVPGTAYKYVLKGGDFEFANKTDLIVNPVLTLDLNAGTLLITGDQEEIEVSLTLAGTFNNWAAADEKYALKATASGYSATYEIPAEAAFKVVMNGTTWMGMSVLKVTSDSNVKATADKDGNFSLTEWNGGTITFTVNEALSTITLDGTENVTPDEGDGDDEGDGEGEGEGDGEEDGDTSSVSSLENDTEEVIYNLQGVRVDRNKLTKGIFIINGKKVMIK